MLVLSTLLTVTAPDIKHFELLERNDKFVAVKINPAAYKPDIFILNYDKSSVIAVNTSFYWNKTPIGWLKNNVILDSILKYEDIRPTFLIDLANKNQIGKIKNYEELQNYIVAFQAGPTLIENGKIVYRTKAVEEKIKGDVTRRTNHTAIGITPQNKIVIIFGYNSSLLELSNKFLSYKCESAINFDGGKSAFLKIENKIYGSYKPFIGLQFFRNK